MKFINLNLRNIGAVAVIVLLLFVGVSDVLATITITDASVSDSTHGIIIDFDNASAFFTNMTTENATFTQNVTFNRPFNGQVYNQATPPDIPSGTVAWWLNSTDGNLSVVVDIGGAQYYVCNGTGPGGGVYIAGSGLNLTGATFSFDGTVFDKNLTWDGSYLNATDTTYSSGTGINITGTTFSFNGTYGNAQYLQHTLFGSNGLIKRTGAGTYSIITDNSANWDTAHGWNNHAIQNYLDDDVADDVDDADIDWGSGAGQVDTDDVPEGSVNFWCDLARIQSLLTNDFHNIGGADDDVPESGDFGAAGDLNADGTITDGSVSESNLDIDNAPTDEHVLTWESSSGKMHWQAESAGGSGYHNDSLIWNSNNNSWLPTGANIINAISDLSGHGKVQLPTGLIYLSADIDINVPGVELCGTGMNSTILKLTSGSFADDVIGIGYDNIATACHNCTLRDFTIDCNNQTGWSAIGTYGANDLVIDHVRVLNAKYTGIKLASRDVGPPAVDYPQRVLVTNCRIINCGLSGSSSHGIGGAGDNATITNIYIDGLPSGCLGLDAANTRNSLFSNIRINDCGDGGMKIDSTQRLCYGNVFSSFTITNCGHEGTYGAALAVTGDSSGVNYFSDFMIENCKRGIGAYGGGGNSTFTDFHIKDTGVKKAILCIGNGYRFFNIHVDGVDDLDQADGAVQIGYSTSTTYNIQLNNIYINNIVDGDHAVAGIKFYDAHSCTLTNFHIKDTDSDAINIDFGSSRIVVMGGIIENAGYCGIYVGDTDSPDTNNITILGTQIYNTVSDSIRTKAVTEWFIINNNICDNDIDLDAATSSTRICPTDTNIYANFVTS